MYPTEYLKQSRKLRRRVLYEGTTALKKGTGVCYNRDYGTAANVDESRDKRVEIPSTSNNLWFAGVTAKAYPAQTEDQWIEIFEPGSVCEVRILKNTTIGATYSTCSVNSADVGTFSLQGFPGKGTAFALQTLSPIISSRLTGAAALDSAGTTLTDSAATFTTDGVAAGDKVVIFSGEDDNTNAYTQAEYTVSSVTSETVLVLTAAAADGGTMQVSYYIYDDASDCLCLAYLQTEGDGPGGLQQVISPKGAGTVAVASMVNGKTYVGGGYALAADSTATLANGTFYGQHKAFQGLGTLTTSDYKVTVTSGIEADMTALASVAFDAADEIINLVWQGAWVELYSTGATKA